MTVSTSFYALCDQGLVRQRNEDRWKAVEKAHFWVLSDGMGGHLGGDIAAEITVDTVSAFMQQHRESNDHSVEAAMHLVRGAIVAANQAVSARARTDRSLRGMGATMTVLYLCGREMIYAHVGDSRIYQLRNGGLLRLTDDHSLVTELLESGHISEEQAEQFIYKHVVTRAIGTRVQIEPDIHQETVEPGDLYMMCSDGLTDILGDTQIEAVLTQSQSLEKAAHSLRDHVYARGAPDNITILLVRIDA